MKISGEVVAVCPKCSLDMKEFPVLKDDGSRNVLAQCPMCKTEVYLELRQ